LLINAVARQFLCQGKTKPDEFIAKPIWLELFMRCFFIVISKCRAANRLLFLLLSKLPVRQLITFSSLET
jgi:hypothetical protein